MNGKTLFEAIGYADEKYVSRPFSKFYVSKTRENASKVWDVVKITAGVAAVIAVILAIWIPSVLLRGPQPSTSTTDTDAPDTTITSAYETDGITTAEPVVTEPLFEKEFEIKALINHAEGYDGKAKVRFTAYEEAEDVINGRRIDIELIGKDGSVLDSRKFHGYGFIALGENKDQNVSYIVIYDVMLHSDRTVTSGTAIILITDEDPDLYLEGVPHFTDFEAGAGIGSVPVYGRYLNAKRKDVALYYSKCTQVLYDAYSVCSGALYSVYECDKDGAGFYEYGELPVTEDRITSIGFTTIDDWAAYFNAFVLQDPSDLQDKRVL